MQNWQIKLSILCHLAIGTRNAIGMSDFKTNLKFLYKMSKVNIKPLADRVLVEPAEAEAKDCIRNYHS